jgi:intraflagellar transport protein 140
MAATRQYRKKGEVTTLVFGVLASKKLDRGNESLSSSTTHVVDRIKPAFSPPFFFGTSRGLIFFADDLGHCSEIQALSSSIDSMTFFEETGRLVVITRSLLLTQFQVTSDGKVTLLSQVKLSVAASEVIEAGIKSVCWASPGLLATVTLEKMVSLIR